VENVDKETSSGECSENGTKSNNTVEQSVDNKSTVLDNPEAPASGNDFYKKYL